MVFQAIGLMSGTSLDGLDICLAKFEKQNSTWKFEIIKAETLSYSEHWENQLRNSIHLSAEELLELHSEYGFFLGKAVKNFISKYNLFIHYFVIASLIRLKSCSLISMTPSRNR